MMKRIFDFFFSFLGLLVLSPMLLLVAICIKLFDGGSVFFRQERIGRFGKSFRIFKFRTMAVNAEQIGGALTIGHDRRITPIGQILRRYKLDELPQLLNVLCGQMSLVGPRPEVPKYVNEYTVEQKKVLELRPGITDPASLAFFNESQLLSQVADPERFYKEQLIGEKIRINLQYARRASLYTDLVLILVTLGRAFGFKFDIFRWLQIEFPKLKGGT